MLDCDQHRPKYQILLLIWMSLYLLSLQIIILPRKSFLSILMDCCFVPVTHVCNNKSSVHSRWMRRVFLYDFYDFINVYNEIWWKFRRLFCLLFHTISSLHCIYLNKYQEINLGHLTLCFYHFMSSKGIIYLCFWPKLWFVCVSVITFVWLDLATWYYKILIPFTRT